MATNDYAGLGERLKVRREHLGLQPQHVAQLDGPSVLTLRSMEQGKPVRRRLGVTYPLEQIYGWAAGAINGYLDYGTEPHVVREPDYSYLTMPGAVTPDKLKDVPTEVLRQALSARDGST